MLGAVIQSVKFLKFKMPILLFQIAFTLYPWFCQTATAKPFNCNNDSYLIKPCGDPGDLLNCKYMSVTTLISKVLLLWCLGFFLFAWLVGFLFQFVGLSVRVFLIL